MYAHPSFPKRSFSRLCVFIATKKKYTLGLVCTFLEEWGFGGRTNSFIALKCRDLTNYQAPFEKHRREGRGGGWGRGGGEEPKGGVGGRGSADSTYLLLASNHLTIGHGPILFETGNVPILFV